MRNRLLIMGLYWISLMALAWATHVALVGWLLISLAAVPGVFRSLHPAVRFLIEAVLLGLSIVVLPSAWLAILEIVTAIAALTVSKSSAPLPDRAIIGSLVMTAIAALISRPAGWAFIPVGAVAVTALVNGRDRASDQAAGRTRLALSLAAVSAMGAAALGLIVRALPWQTVVAGVFSAIAYPFMVLASKIHLHFRHHHIAGFGSVGAPHRLAPPATHYHPPMFVSVLLIAVVVLLVAFLVFLAYIFWAHNDTSLDTEADEPGIVRETIEGLTVSALAGSVFRPTTPVRRLAFDRLREAQRTGRGREPSETLREWVRHVEEDIDASVTSIYEAVRYGGASDTPEKRRHLELLWPRLRHRDHKKPHTPKGVG